MDVNWNDLWLTVQQWFVWLWAQWQTKTLVYLIGANFAVAVAVTMTTGEFLLGRLGEVLYKKVIPWLLVYGAFAFAGEALELNWVANAAFALITTTLTADLLDNLGKLGVLKDIVPVMLKK